MMPMTNNPDILYQVFGLFAHLLTDGFKSSTVCIQVCFTLYFADPGAPSLGQGTEKNEHTVSSSDV